MTCCRKPPENGPQNVFVPSAGLTIEEEVLIGLVEGFNFLIKNEPKESYFDRFSISASSTLQSKSL